MSTEVEALKQLSERLILFVDNMISTFECMVLVNVPNNCQYWLTDIWKGVSFDNLSWK
jgi:hypothetical protein